MRKKLCHMSNKHFWIHAYLIFMHVYIILISYSILLKKYPILSKVYIRITVTFKKNTGF